MEPLDTETWRRASELFLDALEQAPEDRDGWIDARTEGEPRLRREVHRLLDSHERTGLLDRAPPGMEDLGDADEDLAPRLQEALGDRYRVVRELGRGGMAVVFLAWEEKHDRPVVLKVLRPAVATLFGPDRFVREIRLLGRLSHPHILALIDSGAADGLLYYVMPAVEGETLQERLARRGRLPREEALTLLRDIAAALAYAHGEGVVHRDLKPANILCAGSHAYLMDFGVAKVLAAPEPGHTRTGMAIGTPRYMAPEQLRGEPDVGHRADLWAWGRIAMDLLAPAETEPSSTTTDPRARLAAVRPPLPQELGWLIAACLAEAPSERPPDAGLLVDAATPGTAVSWSPPDRGKLRRRRLGAGVLAAGGVAAVASLAWAFGRSDAPPPGPAPFPEGALAVAELRNETGDSSLAFIGRMAADWITQGIQQTGMVEVVPWTVALEASRGPDGSEFVEPDAAIGTLRDAAGASAVVTGSFYRVGSDLRFQVQLVDAVEGRVISAPEPVTAPTDSVEPAIRVLRDRMMGSVAVLRGAEAGELQPDLARRPPTFEAYRAFDRGMELYLAQDYGAATPAFVEAYQRDTTFHSALLYAATTAYNSGELARVDSLLALLEPRRPHLTPYDSYRLDFLEALVQGDAQRSLRALRSAAAIAPRSRSAYNLALVALSMNRPREALAALEALDPQRGALRGWAQYWTQLTHALHLLEQHGREAEAATVMWRRHPERRIATVLLARALAATGRLAALDSLLAETEALPPRTYWSHGAALVVAGEELLAHGRPAEARRYLERALAWLDREAATAPDDEAFAYWRGSALYDLRRWEEAHAVFAGLLARDPDDDGDRGMTALAAARSGDAARAEALLDGGFVRDAGTGLAYRARLRATMGNPEQAISLLSEGLERGVDSWPWLHASAYHDLASLAGDARFERVMQGDQGSPP